jgi:simple sugar transport system permease protein
MDWAAIFGVGLFSSGLQLAMPTALAAVGETFSQRAGNLNLGLEGMMLIGAFTSFVGAYYGGGPVTGVVAGIAAGMLLGALMAFLSVQLKTEQVINGIAIVIFAQGITAFAFEKSFGLSGTTPQLSPLRTLHVPLLGSVPWIGEALFQQNALFYFSIAVIAVVALALRYTRLGLSVRAVGESPAAGDAAGVGVDRVRWFGFLLSGAMAGLGGAVLIVGQVNVFILNITAGRGWVAVALVIFGRWRPLLVALGALAFGILDALQLRIQSSSGGTNSGIPYEVFEALPYVLTLAVMIASTIWSKREAQPAALGIPFKKEVPQ